MSKTPEPKKIYVTKMAKHVCGNCHTSHLREDLNDKENCVYSVGEYLRARLCKIQEVCKDCYPSLTRALDLYRMRQNRHTNMVPYQGSDVPNFLITANSEEGMRK